MAIFRAEYLSSIIVLVLTGSSRGLVDKGAGFFIKLRVLIPKKSVLVLGRASNLKMFLCYIRKPCSVASIVGYSSVTSKEKKMFRFLTWENAEVKIM